jgi:hypothetical protein
LCAVLPMLLFLLRLRHPACHTPAALFSAAWSFGVPSRALTWCRRGTTTLLQMALLAKRLQQQWERMSDSERAPYCVLSHQRPAASHDAYS